jgi:hypothetical protein
MGGFVRPPAELRAGDADQVGGYVSPASAYLASMDEAGVREEAAASQVGWPTHFPSPPGSASCARWCRGWAGSTRAGGW